MDKKIKIFIDTDIGSEMTDAATLCLAATAPEIELIGVSTVTHDTVFRASVAKKFLEILDQGHIPVSAGFGKEAKHVWEEAIVFPEGYYPAKLDEREGYKLILDLVDQYKNEVTLVGIGTLTNIAKALEVDPLFPRKVKRLVLMGGMIQSPVIDNLQIPIGFEYNFCNDGKAAEQVIKGGFNLTMLPGDITFDQNDPWTKEELIELASINNPAVQLLSKLQQTSQIEANKGLVAANLPTQFAKPWVNDELLIAYLIKPQLFETQDVYVNWELPDKYPRIEVSDSGIPLTLINKANFTEARNFILDRLSSIQ